jgi:hypothetical protein
MTDSERQQILKMIEDGKITAAEGLKLIQALEEAPADDEALAPEPEFVQEPDPASPREKSHPEFARKIDRFRKLWVIPLVIGLLITLPSAIWMYNIIQAGSMGGWFFFAFLLFLLGVGVTAFGAGSRTMRWIYVNVNEHKPGKAPVRIVLAFPIPVGLVQWGVSSFGHRIPQKQRKITDEVLDTVLAGPALDEPLLVDVDDDDAHVQVYIG